MSNYNEGARGRARYWMERAQRAEAVLGKYKRWLSEAHEGIARNATPLPETNQVQRGVVQEPNGPAWYEKPASPPDPEGTATQAMGQLDEIQWNMDVLHAPEQGCEYSIRCVICDAIVTPEDGGLCDKQKYDEQAHGDALAALDELSRYAEAGCKTTEDHRRAGKLHGRLRFYLTASGVPDEAIRSFRVARDCTTCKGGGAQAVRQYLNEGLDLLGIPRDEAGDRIVFDGASGVPDGYKMVPVEPTPQMLDATWDHDEAKIESHNTRNHRIWSAMIASAPSDWMDVLEREDWGLVPINVPTGGDDNDVEWTVVQYHMADPKERVIGRGRTPREALIAAAPTDGRG